MARPRAVRRQEAAAARAAARAAGPAVSWPDPTAALEAGWLAIALLVPVAFFPASQNAFELPKQIVFRLCFFGALLVAAALALAKGETVLHRGGRALREVGPAAAVAAALAVALVVSTTLSVAPAVSLWGGPPPSGGGLRTLLCYVLLFLVAALTLRDERQLHRLMRTVAAAGALTALYALVQAAGLDPFAWSSRWGSVDPSVRPAGTFGNPNFLGAYLVPAMCLTLGGLLAAWRRAGLGPRAVWAGAAAVQLAAIVSSETRGAWVGATAGTALLVLLVVAQRGGPWRRWLLAGIAVAAVAALALWAAQPLLPEGGKLARAASLFRPAAGSGGIRLVLWRLAGDLWLVRPLAGHGPDTFESVAEQALRPGDEAFLSGTGATRAENAVLDTLAATGVLGLAPLLALCGLALWRGAMVARRSVSPLPAAAVAALGAHFVGAQVLIAETGVTTLAALLCGAAVGLPAAPGRARLGTTDLRRDGAPARRRRQHSGAALVPVALAAAVAATLGMARWELRAVQASMAHGQALGAQAAGRPEEALRSLERAVALWPHDFRLWNELAGLRGEAAASLPRDAQPAAYAEALRAADRAVALNPVHPQVVSDWGTLAGQVAAVLGDASLAERARAVHAAATARTPHSSYPWKAAGATELRLQRPAVARDYLRRATELLPPDWQSWALLGEASVALGERDAARAALQQALKRQPGQPQVRRALEALDATPPRS